MTPPSEHAAAPVATVAESAPQETCEASQAAERPVDPAPTLTPPPPDDDWEAEELLRRLGRALASEAKRPAPTVVTRVDRAHLSAPSTKGERSFSVPPPRSLVRSRKRRAGSRLSFFASSIAWMGTTAAACGAALLVWSHAATRPELWTVGVPTVIGGVVGVAVGLVLHRDLAWQRRVALQAETVERKQRRIHGPQSITPSSASGKSRRDRRRRRRSRSES